MYTCPADKPEIMTNDIVEGVFCLPEGADSIWNVRDKPSYSADVS